MKARYLFYIFVLIAFSLVSCKQKEKAAEMKIIFLHHSTGDVIWNGAPPNFFTKAARKVGSSFADQVTRKGYLPQLFESYNKEHHKNYLIEEMEFPKASPYGWNNYPFDYYNIWVNHAGEEPFNEEPTLELLTKDYQLIIFKHCYPVSNIEPDQDSADINSYVHTVSNYKLQYNALKRKLHTFPETNLILFTGAVRVKSALTEDEARRTKEFFTWVKEEWDQPGDNIYIWDLYSLQRGGGLYFKDEYAQSADDSHPNGKFAKNAADLLFTRIIDVIENEGVGTQLTGEVK